MLIWTVAGGESGATDTLHRAATEACEATVCVGDGETRMSPVYDPGRRYDPDATRQIGHHLLDQLATDIAEWPRSVGEQGKDARRVEQR